MGRAWQRGDVLGVGTAFSWRAVKSWRYTQTSSSARVPMSDKQKQPSTKIFREGVLFSLLGGLLLFFLEPGRNGLGIILGYPFGLALLTAGILRILKSQKPAETSTGRVSEHSLTEHRANAESGRRETPIFIKVVALSPIVPLCIVLITEASCALFSWCTQGEQRVFMETMGWLGIGGWLVSLPLAGMLSMVHSAARSD